MVATEGDNPEEGRKKEFLSHITWPDNGFVFLGSCAWVWQMLFQPGWKAVC